MKRRRFKSRKKNLKRNEYQNYRKILFQIIIIITDEIFFVFFSTNVQSDKKILFDWKFRVWFG